MPGGPPLGGGGPRSEGGEGARLAHVDTFLHEQLGNRDVPQLHGSLEDGEMLLGLFGGGGVDVCPMAEEHLRRSLLLSNGDYSVFVTSPISAVLLFLTCLILAVSIIPSVSGFYRRRKASRHA